jgi:hypothetical protein
MRAPNEVLKSMSKLSGHSARIFAALVLSGVVFGCSSDKSPAKTTPPPSETYLDFCQLPKPCQDIAQACHSKDDGSPGPIHDCHIIGHEVGTLAACQPKHDSCLTTCNNAEALSDGPAENLYAACQDSGTTDSGSRL